MDDENVGIAGSPKPPDAARLTVNPSGTPEAEGALPCGVCGAPNLVNSRFCPQCGSPVGKDADLIARAARAAVPDVVDRMLREKYKDQKSVELETAELIAERTMKWAKALGFFLGIPALLIAAIFSFIGIKTYGDVSATLDKVTVARTALEASQKQLESTQTKGAQLAGEVENAAGRIRKLSEEAATLSTELAGARTRLAAIPQIEQRQRDIEVDLKNIKSYVLRDSSAVPQDRRRKLDTLISQYRTYLNERGLPGPAKVPEVTTEGDRRGMISYYLPDKGQIVIDKRAIDDDGVVLREFTHHYLLSVTPFKMSGEEADAVESTVAFYLPASFLKDPAIGGIAAKNLGHPRRYFVNLNNEKTFAEFESLPREQRPHDGAEILGAMLWNVRDVAGRERADTILIRTWIEFAKPSNKADSVQDFFKLYLRHARTALDQATASRVASVFARRGMPL